MDQRGSRDSMVHLFLRDNQARPWHLALPIVAMLMLLLVACEQDQRAVPPGAVRDVATAAAGEQNDMAGDEAGFPGLTAGGFSEETRPSAERVFFPRGQDLWYVSVEDDPEPITEDLTIAGFSSNATGDRLAILSVERAEDDQERLELSILFPNQGDVFEQDAAIDAIDLEQMSPIESISLNPAGDEIAITHRNGAMTLAARDGDVRQLLSPSMEHSPGRVSWSADGQFIAYLDPWMPDELSSLYISVPEHDLRQVLVQAADERHGVVRAAWIPGTSHLAVVKESGSTLSHGGDLFLIDAETGRKELLMSSGEIAPVAGIVDFASSPDGTWLAVSGFVPGGEYPAFAGLWFINLQSGLRTPIELEGADPVTDLWWLGDNLLVRTIDEPRTSLPGSYTGREEFRLLEIDPDTLRVTERYPVDPDDDDDERDDNDDADD